MGQLLNVILPGARLPFEVQNALIFDGSYMTRNFAQVGDRKTWTFNFWPKLPYVDAIDRAVFRVGNSYFGFGRSGGLNQFYFVQDGVWTGHTTMDFRDVSKWYCFNIRYDTTQAVAADRVRLQVDGEDVALTTETGALPALDSNGPWNDLTLHELGRNAANQYDNLAAEIAFVDGAALDSSRFGWLDGSVWRPTRPRVASWGDNGFYLNFQNAANLGEDAIGSNDWTLVGPGSPADQTQDTPTNNACIWSMIDTGYAGGGSISRGGSLFTGPLGRQSTRGGFYQNTGDWFYEVACDSIQNNAGGTKLAWATDDANIGGDLGFNTPDSWGARIRVNGSSSYVNNGTGGQTNIGVFNVADHVGIRWDVDARMAYVYKNGVQVYVEDLSGTMSAGKTWSAAIADESGTLVQSGQINAGQEDLAYSYPEPSKLFNESNFE